MTITSRLTKRNIKKVSPWFYVPTMRQAVWYSHRYQQVTQYTKEDNPDENAEDSRYGYITVIENVFHYKQVIPLKMGVNVIGRYMKNSGVNCAIETNDPSIDINHCSITVSRGKNGKLKYVLKDGPSYTGTFVDNVILGDREQRVIEDGTLFTIGATSVILHTQDENEENK